MAKLQNQKHKCPECNELNAGTFFGSFEISLEISKTNRHPNTDIFGPSE
jgi:phage FluMu protein Com